MFQHRDPIEISKLTCACVFRLIFHIYITSPDYAFNIDLVSVAADEFKAVVYPHTFSCSLSAYSILFYQVSLQQQNNEYGSWREAFFSHNFLLKISY